MNSGLIVRDLTLGGKYISECPPPAKQTNLLAFFEAIVSNNSVASSSERDSSKSSPPSINNSLGICENNSSSDDIFNSSKMVLRSILECGTNINLKTFSLVFYLQPIYHEYQILLNLWKAGSQTSQSQLIFVA